MAQQLKIILKKSLAKRTKNQIATARSLGLKKINSYVIQPNNEQTQGKVNKINFLLEVCEI